MRQAERKEFISTEFAQVDLSPNKSGADILGTV